MNLVEKSRTTSFFLTLFFGPLGLLYSSIVGGLILCVMAIGTAGTVIGPIVCWILSILIGDSCTHNHNKSIKELKGLLSNNNRFHPNRFPRA